MSYKYLIISIVCLWVFGLVYLTIHNDILYPQLYVCFSFLGLGLLFLGKNIIVCPKKEPLPTYSEQHREEWSEPLPLYCRREDPELTENVELSVRSPPPSYYNN